MELQSLESAILKHGSMCVIPVPFDPKEIFGKIRAPVRVTINEYTFQSTIAVMGGQTCIPLRKSHCEAAAVKAGDVVQVKISADHSIRTIQVPEALATALNAKPDIWQCWSKLSYTSQREAVESVLEAKRPLTRARRIKKIVDQLTQHANAKAVKPGTV